MAQSVSRIRAVIIEISDTRPRSPPNSRSSTLLMAPASVCSLEAFATIVGIFGTVHVGTTVLQTSVIQTFHCSKIKNKTFAVSNSAGLAWFSSEPHYAGA
jgi:hypothetical protein